MLPIAASIRLVLSVLLTLFFLSSVAAKSFASAVDYAAQRISIALTAEPPNLDSAKTTDSISITILSHLNEGLLAYDLHGNLIAGVAKEWHLTETAAHFVLRDNARWSDGKPVTAADFVYAWRRALDPANASSYAFLLYPIKNARAINQGDLPIDKLGVIAVDDTHLRIELERPCAYFLSLMAFPTYYPQREDFVSAQGRHYAAEADRLLFNGPYRLSEWKHGASLRMEKNTHYWDAENIQIREIDVAHITSDTTALLNLFKNNEIAMTDLGAETLETALNSRLYLRQYPTGFLFYVRFNLRDQRLTANKALRQAMQAVFDSHTYVNKVVARPGVMPGQSIFPASVRGKDGLLREEYPLAPVNINLKRARALLTQAKQQLQVDELPPLLLLTSDAPAAIRHAEYLQNLFRIALGIELRLERQIAKQFWARERRGEFDLSISGWGPDYDDAMTFADLFASWNQNNRGQHNSPEYDHWVEVAQNSLDPDIRMQAFDQMQRIIQRDAVILPLFESALIYVQHPQLVDVARYRFGGDISFRFARVLSP